MSKFYEASEKRTETHREMEAVESRRDFFKTAAVGVAAATGALAVGKASADDFSAGAPDPAAGFNSRADETFDINVDLQGKLRMDTLALPDQLDNDDETRYENDSFYASFTKGLPHNNIGEVNPNAFRGLALACRTGRKVHFDAIRLSALNQRPLENPQGAFRYVQNGLDSHATRMRPAPTFRSAETAGEMGEVYWKSKCLDVPFNQYSTDSTIGDALSDLNSNFSHAVGPTDGMGNITSDTIFRGDTSSDLIGPYLNQFLWHDVGYGPSNIVQQYAKPQAGTGFMTSEFDWLLVQLGANPRESATMTDHRYIYNARGLAEYVHGDALFQAYFNAALITLGIGGTLDPTNPYVGGPITNQSAFTALGGPMVLDLVTQAGNLALTGAWFQKWRVHRRLRPEVYAGRVHHQMQGNANYELHSDILNSDVVARCFSDNGSYFLPMAYPEGSPRHPSYPAGHATVAGSCVTVLKAVFNEDFVIPNPVVSNDDGTALVPYTGPDLTLGNEFNKLAANVSLGRDWAGVHYRSDGTDGNLVGEQQAIGLLRLQSMNFHEEDFAGFNLTMFNGTKINIANGNVTIV